MVAAGWVWFGADWEGKTRIHPIQPLLSILLSTPIFGFPAPNTTVLNPLEFSVSFQSDHFLFAWFSVFPASRVQVTQLLILPRKPASHAAAIIDGKSIAQDIRFRVAGEIRRAKAAIGKSPGLAVVLVGKRRDSKTYINIKLRACDEVGIVTLIAELPENCTETELLDVVLGFNEDPSVHGIIVQLPLPQVISPTVFASFSFFLHLLCCLVFLKCYGRASVNRICILVDFYFCLLKLLLKNRVVAVNCAVGWG